MSLTVHIKRTGGNHLIPSYLLPATQLASKAHPIKSGNRACKKDCVTAYS
jgi:hypothetical protein